MKEDEEDDLLSLDSDLEDEEAATAASGACALSSGAGMVGIGMECGPTSQIHPRPTYTIPSPRTTGQGKKKKGKVALNDLDAQLAALERELQEAGSGSGSGSEDEEDGDDEEVRGVLSFLDLIFDHVLPPLDQSADNRFPSPAAFQTHTGRRQRRAVALGGAPGVGGGRAPDCEGRRHQEPPRWYVRGRMCVYKRVGIGFMYECEPCNRWVTCLVVCVWLALHASV